jgi:hypothetical protein
MNIQGLLRRIERLEQKEMERNGIFVAPIYEGETEEEARRLAGVPENASMVVLIRRFSETLGTEA